MNQCDRIKLILQENKLKQKELAAEIGVTESYISILLKKPNVGLSRAVATVIQEKYGYSVDWVLNGTEPKLKQTGKNQKLSETHQRAMVQMEKLNEHQVQAVLAFLKALEDIENALAEDGQTK